MAALPMMRPIAIDPFNSDALVYAGVHQCVLGQIGFRVDTRSTPFRSNGWKTLRGRLAPPMRRRICPPDTMPLRIWQKPGWNLAYPGWQHSPDWCGCVDRRRPRDGNS